MKQKLFTMMAAAVLLVGMTGCSKDDNPSLNNMEVLEQSLIGLWWDEFEYADMNASDLKNYEDMLKSFAEPINVVNGLLKAIQEKGEELKALKEK